MGRSSATRRDIGIPAAWDTGEHADAHMEAVRQMEAHARTRMHADGARVKVREPDALSWPKGRVVSAWLNSVCGWCYVVEMDDGRTRRVSGELVRGIKDRSVR